MRAFVKIDKKERDTLHGLCLDSGHKVEFFTLEENEVMIMAAIDVLDPGMLFYLGRMLNFKLELQSCGQ